MARHELGVCEHLGQNGGSYDRGHQLQTMRLIDDCETQPPLNVARDEASVLRT
jgi:hypothetical protein